MQIYETLEAKLIRTALPGFSKADCPGGFVAYIGKPDNRAARVSYVHQNTDKRIHEMTYNQIRDYVRGFCS